MPTGPRPEPGTVLPGCGSGVDDDGDDEGLAGGGAERPVRHGTGEELFELVCVSDAFLGRGGQGLLDDGDDRLEGGVVVDEAAGQEVGGLGEGAGVCVDDRHHRDHAFGGEGEAVLEGRFGGAADFHAVHVDVAGGDLAGDGRAPVDEVDDDAVLGDDDPVGVDAGTDGEVAVGPQVAPFAVYGHDVAGFDDVVAVDEFAGAGVSGDVHLGVALVDHVGAPSGESVDHPVDG